MASYRLLVLTNPVAGREEEYNQWYSEQHLGDVLRVPGFTGAQRFRLLESLDASKSFPWRYVALYDIETDDLAGVLRELSSRGGTTALPVSTALEMSTVAAVSLAPITPHKSPAPR
jgi:hypothetical protein